MKRSTRYAPRLLASILLGLISGVSIRASDRIELAGDVVQYLLPATAAGLTLGYKDGEGALQLGESAALTLGVTYSLKYSIDEKRPNGRRHSFPSGHSSISFSSAEFMRKRYGWEYGIPAYAAATFVAYSRVEAREHHPYTIVKRLPKTRSGKILRGTIKRIADGVEYRIPPTIDDPAILDEITADLTALGYGHRAATSRAGRQRGNKVNG